MLRRFASVLLGLTACFAPDIQQGLPCSESGDCPGDMSCENGICWSAPHAVVAVAAGASHTCAVLDNGALRCWGSGLQGRLGYGDEETVGDDETPASRGSVNVGGSVVGVALGTGHTCAVLESGGLRCWGAATLGRLGYGNSIQIGDDEVPATAGDVPVGGTVTQVALSDKHTCALLDTGTVRCWGDGNAGRLGYGNTDWIGDNELPKHVGDVDVGATVRRVDVGTPTSGAHTCVLLDTGAVRCWGLGEDGRLGYGNIENIGDDEVPASAGDVDVGGTVVQVVAGGLHTCALLDTGAVRCWGEARDGRLGYADGFDIGNDEAPAVAGDVDIGGTAVQLAAGSAHTCALLDTGALRCWGAGANGRLGYGNVENIGDDETPASAGDVPVF